MKGFFVFDGEAFFDSLWAPIATQKVIQRNQHKNQHKSALYALTPVPGLSVLCGLRGPPAPPFTYSCTRPVGVEPTTFGFGNQRSTTELRTFRNDRIRTCDPLLPKQMRYQTALHSVSPSQRLVYKILPSTATQIKKHIDLLRPFDACIFTL